MRRLIRIASTVILVITGLTAIAGGLFLIIAPSGQLTGLSTTWLKNTPFKTYLVPGFILLTAIGFFSMYISCLVIARKKHAAVFMAVEGIILLAWTIAQVVMFSKLSFLQPAYGLAGIVMIISGFSQHRTDIRKK